MNKPCYKLLDWIDSNYLDLQSLCENPNALDIIEANLHKEDEIGDYELSSNTNPRAIEILRKRQGLIQWNKLSANPAAVQLLKENYDYIDWYYLMLNPEAMELIEKNQHKIHWNRLSQNPSAVDFLIAFVPLVPSFGLYQTNG